MTVALKTLHTSWYSAQFPRIQETLNLLEPTSEQQKEPRVVTHLSQWTIHVLLSGYKQSFLMTTIKLESIFYSSVTNVPVVRSSAEMFCFKGKRIPLAGLFMIAQINGSYSHHYTAAMLAFIRSLCFKWEHLRVWDKIYNRFRQRASYHFLPLISL